MTQFSTCSPPSLRGKRPGAGSPEGDSRLAEGSRTNIDSVFVSLLRRIRLHRCKCRGMVDVHTDPYARTPLRRSCGAGECGGERMLSTRADINATKAEQ